MPLQRYMSQLRAVKQYLDTGKMAWEVMSDGEFTDEEFPYRKRAGD